jgi:hypothetical protein
MINSVAEIHPDTSVLSHPSTLCCGLFVVYAHHAQSGGVLEFNCLTVSLSHCHCTPVLFTSRYSCCANCDLICIGSFSIAFPSSLHHHHHMVVLLSLVHYLHTHSDSIFMILLHSSYLYEVVSLLYYSYIHSLFLILLVVSTCYIYCYSVYVY